MPIYSRDIVLQVLSATDITDIIGPVVSLKPAGRGRMKALCPFHQEKTPSFIVNQERQTFHCFGCSKGGDALSFVQENLGLTFIESLRMLADRAGIQLPAASPQAQQADSHRHQILDFSRFVARFYRDALLKAHPESPAVQYLNRRGISDATLERFAVGLALRGGESLREAAARKQYPLSVLESSGLVRRGERGGMYDFFRDRIIFPVRDVAGNYVAFGGRALDDSPAKYINSPENPVYRKSRVLYGLHEARDTLRQSEYALVVEGYFDLLRCFDSGLENVVATCGTALTLEQASLLRRYVHEVVLLYDGDAAGVKAALRGVAVLTEAGLRVRALQLPQNQDPDDFIREQGAEALRERITNASDFIGFYVDMSRDRAHSIEGRTEIAQELFGIVRHIDDAMRLDEYLKEIATALDLNAWACRQEFEKYLREGRKREAWAARMQSTEAENEAKPVVNRDDAVFLAVLLNDSEERQRIRTLLRGIPLGDSPLERIMRLLLQRDDLDKLLHDLEQPEARSLYTAAMAWESDVDDIPEDLLDKRVNRVMRDALQQQCDIIRRAIEEAARNADTQRYWELLAEQGKLTRQMEQVGVT